jgi:hypothetical protein
MMGHNREEITHTYLRWKPPLFNGKKN